MQRCTVYDHAELSFFEQQNTMSSGPERHHGGRRQSALEGIDLGFEGSTPPTAIHPVAHRTVNLSEDGIRHYVTALPPRKKQKTQSKKLGEGREEGVEWSPAGDFEDDNIEARDVDLEDFDMLGWKQYAPAFAMDASGELVDDFSARTGKRKRYDSSVSLSALSALL